MKISVSMLSAYLYCPRMLFLQKILALEEPPKESLVLGSIRHEAFDLINKKEESVVKGVKEPIDFNYLLNIHKELHSSILKTVVIRKKAELREANLGMAEAFESSWASVSHESETRASVIFDFVQKHNLFGNELWEKLTPKISSEFRIESDLMPLKGIIDQVYIYGSQYVPYELKTGKAPRDGVWPGHKIQLGAYAMMLEEKFKIPVKEGFVYYLDSKEKRHIAVNPFLKDEIANLVKEVMELIENKALPKLCENKAKCRACSFKGVCYNEELLAMHMREADLEI